MMFKFSLPEHEADGSLEKDSDETDSMRLPFEGKDFGCKHHLFATVVRKLELIFVDAGHVICIISNISLT